MIKTNMTVQDAETLLSGKLSRSEIESLIDEWIIGRNATLHPNL